MHRLNYHHLYYFWRVAVLGNLTQAAHELHVSQSALSAQIKQLEHAANTTLFDRVGRRLVLTDAGRRVLAYAEDIFATGEELESFLRQGGHAEIQRVSIGVLTHLSRNFVDSFLGPLLQRSDVQFSLKTQGMTELLQGLSSHEFDLVLTNRAVTTEGQGQAWHTQLVDRQPVAIVGPAEKTIRHPFPTGYADHEWILPSRHTEIRSAFDALCATHQFTPKVKAEVDDMAMMRLIVRDSGAIAVLPPVVVKDEINQGLLAEYQRLPNTFEHFYAIRLPRKFSAAVIAELLKAMPVHRD